MLSDPQAHLLALCLIPDLNWHLIAREAQRPKGLDGLLSGDMVEHSPQASKAREILRTHLDEVPDHLREASTRAESGFQAGAGLTTVLDPSYPETLRQIFNLPPFLFVRGEIVPEDLRSVAVVGARDATDEGLRRARKLADMLVEEGITVVSGLARGIDTAAHTATLEASGRTVAVMGTGICHCYPPENNKLAEEIASRGALVSQFWPLARPARYTFPRRNVTMSGLAQGTAVIEASPTSGAKMQARKALEHGKTVFLLGSLVDSREWAQKYVDQGAIRVESVEDITAHLVDPSRIKRRVDRDRQLLLNLE